MVRPNFRIGNILISASIFRTITQAFPHAQIDYIGTDTTRSLLDGQPYNHYFCISRKFILRPWRLAKLLHTVRQRKYDVVIDLGFRSLSSRALTFYCKPKHTIGAKTRHDAIYNLEIPLAQKRAYDWHDEFASIFGQTDGRGPYYKLTEIERTAARRWLLKSGIRSPFVGIFIGGHLKKRWGTEAWNELIQRLDIAGLTTVVFNGPEELSHWEEIQQKDLSNCYGVPLLPIREVAAICVHATLVVTPDTGPMHLATALGVPVVAMNRSRLYTASGRYDESLMNPSVEQVFETIIEHPLLRTISRERASA